MPRGLTADLAAAFEAKHVAPVLFVAAQFKSGFVYLWSGYGLLDWNGHTWTGLVLPQAGMLAAIDKLGEVTDLSAQTIALSLSGIPRTLVQRILAECRQSYSVTVYLGAMNLDDGSLIDTPICSWAGLMDVPTISEDPAGGTVTVAISVESRLVDLQRARPWRYTHEDQQILSPGDLGFQYVGALQNFTVTWGHGGPVAPLGNVPVKAP